MLNRLTTKRPLLGLVLLTALSACGGGATPRKRTIPIDDEGSGGAVMGMGGRVGQGGQTTGVGGVSGSGGGTTGSGGTRMVDAGLGGATGTGGSIGAGGVLGTGGMPAAGGAMGMGGTQLGMAGAGGRPGMGGMVMGMGGTAMGGTGMGGLRQPDAGMDAPSDVSVDMAPDVAIDMATPDAGIPDAAIYGQGLLGQYFAWNSSSEEFADLRMTRLDSEIFFDWGNGSPDAVNNVPVDKFSVRWTGKITAPTTGMYSFQVRSDDGVRLWINGQQVINDWVDRGAMVSTGSVSLVQGVAVDIRLEYYDNGGQAVAQLSWQKPTDSAPVRVPSSALTPPAGPGDGGVVDMMAPVPAVTMGLRGEYFDEANFTNRKLVRVDPVIDFAWPGAPDPSMGADTYSVRWGGKLTAPATGTYTFTLSSDDGSRLWVDGKLVVNNWGTHPIVDVSGTIDLSASVAYDIRIEFFQGNGGQGMKFSWTPPGSGASVVVPASVLSPGEPDVSANLLGYWKFNEGTGTVAADSSGAGRVASVLGTTTWTVANGGKDGTGLNGIPASRNYAAVAVPNNMVLSPTDQITVAAFIKAVDFNGSRRIVQKGDADDQYQLFADAGVLKFVVSNVGIAAWTMLPSLNVWHHVAGTYDGDAVRLFVDGVAVATTPVNGRPAIPQTTNPLHIGTKSAASGVDGDYFSGVIDEVAVYGRALDALEVARLADGTRVPAPPVAGLVAAFAFNEGTGMSSAEGTGTGLAATWTNAGWTQDGEALPGKGAALVLNGTNQSASIPDSPLFDTISGAVTISAWVYREANSANWSHVISRQEGTGGGEHLALAFNSAGQLSFLGTNITAQGGAVVSPLPIPVGRWVHVAGTFNGLTSKVFVNGVEVASKPRAAAATIATADTVFVIGGNANDVGGVPTELFNGRIDDLRIYNRDLSAGEIQGLAR